MRVLVVGGGGREHALVWKIAQSPLVETLWCAPGNGGTPAQAETVDLEPGDVDGLARFAERHAVDLTVVGPEGPLVAGVRDRFESRGLALVGPHAKAAALEGSKVFAKEFMVRQGIPTAPFRVFEDPGEAGTYIRGVNGPLVVKADGLAAGKGVIVCSSAEEAAGAVHRIMVERVFGDAGDRVVVEERLEGREASILALVSGERVVPLMPAMDFKRVGENDAGPNTGGMGSIAPNPAVDGALVDEVVRTVFEPACLGLAAEGMPYEGILYVGLMLTQAGPKVLEFNCRFGDPETQAILPLLESDLVDLLAAVVHGDLESKRVEWRGGVSVSVVLASGGYPGPVKKGLEITGLDRVPDGEGLVVFHAGTTRRGDGTVVTDGGRVLGVTAVGDDWDAASRKAYDAAERIHFPGMQYRTDIGPGVGERPGRRISERTAGGP